MINTLNDRRMNGSQNNSLHHVNNQWLRLLHVTSISGASSSSFCFVFFSKKVNINPLCRSMAQRAEPQSGRSVLSLLFLSHGPRAEQREQCLEYLQLYRRGGRGGRGVQPELKTHGFFGEGGGLSGALWTRPLLSRFTQMPLALILLLWETSVAAFAWRT